MTLSPTQSAIQTALRNFLVGVLPPGLNIIAGQANRVSEPHNSDYVVFWPLLLERLAWNIDSNVDGVFTGSISATTLTITAVDPNFKGKLGVGLYIFGVGVAVNTQIIALGTGTGGVGTYTVSISQTAASQTISAGTTAIMQKTRISMQCDVHGPNSSDNAQIIAIAFRDVVAERYFDPDNTGVAPLYADDPRQVPFFNGENQFETRWIVDVHMQADRTVTFSQQFASAATVDVISVAATYPVS